MNIFNRYTVALFAMLAIAMLAGCAAQVAKIEKFTHDDAMAAAAFDDAHGYKVRADVIRAFDAQVQACLVCLGNSGPSAPPPGGAAITLYEMTAIGIASGFGTAVCKPLCEPIVLPSVIIK